MEIQSRFTQKLVINKLFQGNTNNCGPFCAAMIINTFSDYKTSGEFIAESMNHPTWKVWRPSIKRIPDSATFPWGVVDLLSEYGINSSWSCFNSLDKLSMEVNNRPWIIVITAKIKPLSAHYRIVTAIREDTIGFIDPAYSENIVTWQNKDDFVKGWNLIGRIMIKPRGEYPIPESQDNDQTPPLHRE